jgi:hypothetical protein
MVLETSIGIVGIAIGLRDADVDVDVDVRLDVELDELESAAFEV